MFSGMNLGFGKETELKKSVGNNNNPKLVDESGDQAGTGADSRSPLLKKNEFLKSEPNQREKDAARVEEGCVDKATSLQTEGNLTRTQILSFFEAATNRMRDPEYLKATAEAAVHDPSKRVHVRLMMAQKQVFVEHGIDAEFGTQQMKLLPQDFGSDPDVMAALRGFTQSCNEAYVATVKLKKPKDSKDLEQSLEMEPDDAMEFFEVCDIMMGTSAVKEALADQFNKTKQPPNSMIIDMQKEIIECLGFEKEHGIKTLTKITQSVPALGARMQRFARIAHQSCTEAALGPEGMRRLAEKNRAAHELDTKIREEVSSMTAKEKRSFVEDVLPRQLEHAKVMRDLNEAGKMRYSQSLTEAEQKELRKLSVILSSFGPKGGNTPNNQDGHQHGPNCSHGHHHGHGHQCSHGHDH